MKKEDSVSSRLAAKRTIGTGLPFLVARSLIVFIILLVHSSRHLMHAHAAETAHHLIGNGIDFASIDNDCTAVEFCTHIVIKR